MAKGKVGKTVESLGDYLKEQRLGARLSLRQLAEQVGVSQPLPQPDRARSAQALGRRAAADRQGPARSPRSSSTSAPGSSAPRTGSRRVGRAGDPRRHRPDRAAEAVAARRVRVVPGAQRARSPPPTTAEPPTSLTTRRHRRVDPHRRRSTWPRPSSTSRPRHPPAYVGVGVTDLAVEAVRDSVADVQKRFVDVQKTVSGRLSRRPEDRTSRALARRQGPPRGHRGPRRRAAGRGPGAGEPTALSRPSHRAPTPTWPSAARASSAGSAARSPPRPPSAPRRPPRPRRGPPRTQAASTTKAAAKKTSAGAKSHGPSTTPAAKTTAKTATTGAKRPPRARPRRPRRQPTAPSSAKATATAATEDRVQRDQGRRRRHREGRRLKSTSR